MGFIGLFLIGIVALIIGLCQSSNEKEVNNKTEEINAFASSFIENLEIIMRQTISRCCGVEFFIFSDINNSIINKDISKDYEELLVKTDVLKQDDDVRLFNEEEIDNAMTKWLSITCLRIMKQNHIKEQEALEILKKWGKAQQLISIIKNKYIEQYGEEMLSVVKMFKKEEHPSGKICDIVLDGMKKIMEQAKNEFEKEVIEVKEKYVSFSKSNN